MQKLIDVLCAVSAIKIAGPIFLDSKGALMYAHTILSPFFELLSDYEQTCAFLKKDSVRAHTTNSCALFECPYIFTMC
jgi:hypothetical protein